MHVSEHVWTPPHLRRPRAIRWSDANPPDPPDSVVLEQAFENAERLERGIAVWFMAVRGRVGPSPFPAEALEVE